MESPQQDQDSSPEVPFRETPERVPDQLDLVYPARLRQRSRMLLHYIRLMSKYQDSLRYAGVGEPSSEPNTPQQDNPDMPPPQELVQSIRATAAAVTLHNLCNTRKEQEGSFRPSTK